MTTAVAGRPISSVSSEADSVDMEGSYYGDLIPGSGRDSLRSTKSLSIFTDPNASLAMARSEEMTYNMYEQMGSESNNSSNAGTARRVTQKKVPVGSGKRTSRLESDNTSESLPYDEAGSTENKQTLFTKKQGTFQIKTAAPHNNLDVIKSPTMKDKDFKASLESTLTRRGAGSDATDPSGSLTRKVSQLSQSEVIKENEVLNVTFSSKTVASNSTTDLNETLGNKTTEDLIQMTSVAEAKMKEESITPETLSTSSSLAMLNEDTNTGRYKKSSFLSDTTVVRPKMAPLLGAGLQPEESRSAPATLARPRRNFHSRSPSGLSLESDDSCRSSTLQRSPKNIDDVRSGTGTPTHMQQVITEGTVSKLAKTLFKDLHLTGGTMLGSPISSRSSVTSPDSNAVPEKKYRFQVDGIDNDVVRKESSSNKMEAQATGSKVESQVTTVSSSNASLDSTAAPRPKLNLNLAAELKKKAPTFNSNESQDNYSDLVDSKSSNTFKAQLIESISSSSITSLTKTTGHGDSLRSANRLKSATASLDIESPKVETSSQVNSNVATEKLIVAKQLSNNSNTSASVANLNTNDNISYTLVNSNDNKSLLNESTSFMSSQTINLERRDSTSSDTVRMIEKAKSRMRRVSTELISQQEDLPQSESLPTSALPQSSSPRGSESVYKEASGKVLHSNESVKPGDISENASVKNVLGSMLKRQPSESGSVTSLPKLERQNSDVVQMIADIKSKMRHVPVVDPQTAQDGDTSNKIAPIGASLVDNDDVTPTVSRHGSDVTDRSPIVSVKSRTVETSAGPKIIKSEQPPLAKLASKNESKASGNNSMKQLNGRPLISSQPFASKISRGSSSSIASSNHSSDYARDSSEERVSEGKTHVNQVHQPLTVNVMPPYTSTSSEDIPSGPYQSLSWNLNDAEHVDSDSTLTGESDLENPGRKIANRQQMKRGKSLGAENNDNTSDPVSKTQPILYEPGERRDDAIDSASQLRASGLNIRERIKRIEMENKSGNVGTRPNASFSNKLITSDTNASQLNGRSFKSDGRGRIGQDSSLEDIHNTAGDDSTDTPPAVLYQSKNIKDEPSDNEVRESYHERDRVINGREKLKRSQSNNSEIDDVGKGGSVTMTSAILYEPHKRNDSQNSNDSHSVTYQGRGTPINGRGKMQRKQSDSEILERRRVDLQRSKSEESEPDYEGEDVNEKNNNYGNRGPGVLGNKSPAASELNDDDYSGRVSGKDAMSSRYEPVKSKPPIPYQSQKKQDSARNEGLPVLYHGRGSVTSGRDKIHHNEPDLKTAATTRRPQGVRKSESSVTEDSDLEHHRRYVKPAGRQKMKRDRSLDDLNNVQGDPIKVTQAKLYEPQKRRDSQKSSDSHSVTSYRGRSTPINGRDKIQHKKSDSEILEIHRDDFGKNKSEEGERDFEEGYDYEWNNNYGDVKAFKVPGRERMGHERSMDDVSITQSDRSQNGFNGHERGGIYPSNEDTRYEIDPNEGVHHKSNNRGRLHRRNQPDLESDLDEGRGPSHGTRAMRSTDDPSDGYETPEEVNTRRTQPVRAVNSYSISNISPERRSQGRNGARLTVDVNLSERDLPYDDRYEDMESPRDAYQSNVHRRHVTKEHSPSSDQYKSDDDSRRLTSTGRPSRSRSRDERNVLSDSESNRYNSSPRRSEGKAYGSPGRSEGRGYGSPRGSQSRSYGSSRGSEGRDYGSPRRSEGRGYGSPRRSGSANRHVSRITVGSHAEDTSIYSDQETSPRSQRRSRSVHSFRTNHISHTDLERASLEGIITVDDRYRQSFTSRIQVNSEGRGTPVIGIIHYSSPRGTPTPGSAVYSLGMNPVSVPSPHSYHSSQTSGFLESQRAMSPYPTSGYGLALMDSNMVVDSTMRIMSPDQSELGAIDPELKGAQKSGNAYHITMNLKPTILSRAPSGVLTPTRALSPVRAFSPSRAFSPVRGVAVRSHSLASGYQGSVLSDEIHRDGSRYVKPYPINGQTQHFVDSSRMMMIRSPQPMGHPTESDVGFNLQLHNLPDNSSRVQTPSSYNDRYVISQVQHTDSPEPAPRFILSGVSDTQQKRTGPVMPKIVRGSYLIKNAMDTTTPARVYDVVEDEDDSDSLMVESNANVFDGRFLLSKENPLYFSDQEREDRSPVRAKKTLSSQERNARRARSPRTRHVDEVDSHQRRVVEELRHDSSSERSPHHQSQERKLSERMSQPRQSRSKERSNSPHRPSRSGGRQGQLSSPSEFHHMNGRHHSDEEGYDDKSDHRRMNGYTDRPRDRTRSPGRLLETRDESQHTREVRLDARALHGSREPLSDDVVHHSRGKTERQFEERHHTGGAHTRHDVIPSDDIVYTSRLNGGVDDSSDKYGGDLDRRMDQKHHHLNEFMKTTSVHSSRHGQNNTHTKMSYDNDDFDTELHVNRDYNLYNQRKESTDRDHRRQTSPARTRSSDDVGTLTSLDKLDVLGLIKGVTAGSVRQSIDVDRLDDKLIDSLPHERPPRTSSDVSPSGETSPLDGYDKVEDQMDLDVKDGTAILTARVRSEKIVPIQGTRDLFKKSSVIVTRRIEVDLWVTPQRKSLHEMIVRRQREGRSHHNPDDIIRGFTKKETEQLYRVFMSLTEYEKSLTS